MGDRLEELGGDTEVALVTFTNHDQLIAYQRRNGLPLRILRDPDRVGYRAYGLGRGTVRRVWGWRVWVRYAQILRQSDATLTRATEDTLQLGGDFVIGPDGTLTYGFWGAGPDDRPSVDELIDAVRSTA